MKLFIILSLILNLSVMLVQERGSHSVRYIPPDSSVLQQMRAFAVLQHTCNVCHSKSNRNAVFTFSNMNSWSSRINEQVFVKKRMPKGNTYVLTDIDKIHLRNWLQSLR